MPTLVQTQGWTEEQLMSLPDIGYKWELIDGRLEMSPAGSFHGYLGLRLGGQLERFVRKHKLGRVFDGQTGFWMKSGNLRSPDISFIAKDRLKGHKRPPKGFFHGSPDLVVEILSPSDTLEKTEEKLAEYFENDTVLAWIVDPDKQSVLIYHGRRPDTTLTLDQSLDGEQLIPGFAMPLAEIFEEMDF